MKATIDQRKKKWRVRVFWLLRCNMSQLVNWIYRVKLPERQALKRMLKEEGEATYIFEKKKKPFDFIKATVKRLNYLSSVAKEKYPYTFERWQGIARNEKGILEYVGGWKPIATEENKAYYLRLIAEDSILKKIVSGE